MVMDKQTLISGIIALCGTAVLISFKQVVINGFWWLIRMATTTIEISNTHVIFYTLMEYLERTTALKLKVVKLMNGPWGQLPYTTISVGSGVHFIKLLGRTAMIVMIENHNTNSWMGEKLLLKIIILGKHPKFINELRDVLDESFHRISYHNESLMKIYTYKGDEKQGDWTDTLSIHKRNLNTIYIPAIQKRRIISAIEEFYKSENDHYQKGIPHHLGIMLYGPPGTGKTSLIQALASYFDVHICYLHSSELRYIQNAMTLLPKNAWIVIEDIDSNDVTHLQVDTASKETKKSTRINKNGTLEQVEFTLDQVLNCWDGMLASEGRILFITTNHPEKINPVLLRPGRIDIREEIGYVGKEALSQFCESFYERTADFDIKPRTTISDLQNAVIVNKLNFDDFKANFIQETRGSYTHNSIIF
jgi:chaperone BCS1